MGPPWVWRLTDLSISQPTHREKVSHKVSHHPSRFCKALQVGTHVTQQLAQSRQSTHSSGPSAQGLLVFPRCPGVSVSFSRSSIFLTVQKTCACERWVVGILSEHSVWVCVSCEGLLTRPGHSPGWIIYDNITTDSKWFQKILQTHLESPELMCGDSIMISVWHLNTSQ